MPALLIVRVGCIALRAGVCCFACVGQEGSSITRQSNAHMQHVSEQAQRRMLGCARDQLNNAHV
eukprot:7464800-Alexandrium_andersonii.AAC.1